MEKTKLSGGRDLMVLAGMVTNPTVCARLLPQWQAEGLFADAMLNRLAARSLWHYRKYGEPIRDKLIAWAERAAQKYHWSDASQKFVAEALQFLADKWQWNGEANVDYLMDEAGHVFNLTRQQKLAEEIKAAVHSEDWEKAEALIGKHTRVELGSAPVINLCTDHEEWDDSFVESEGKPLIEYPDDLGYFFADELERENLLAFQGPQKSGKTFLLFDAAYRAVMQGRKVAVFEIGDLSRKRTKQRMIVRVSHWPLRPGKERVWPRKVEYPLEIRYERGAETATIENTKTLTFDGPLDRKEGWKNWRRSLKRALHSAVQDERLKISVHETRTLTVPAMQALLEDWARMEGFVPDIVVVDYADILAPIDRRDDKFDRVNENWAALRSLAMNRKCLVITATQSNAQSFKKMEDGNVRKVQDRTNFSEDNRKQNHATGLVGINMTHEEKTKGLMRLNWLMKREGEGNVLDTVHVASCLPLCEPLVVSAGWRTFS